MMEHEEKVRERALASSRSKPVPDDGQRRIAKDRRGNTLYRTSKTVLVDQSKLIVFLIM